MKKIFLPAIIVLALSTLSSCAKCFTCKNAIEKTKYCTKDKDDQTQIDDIIRNREADGYKCSASSEAL